MKNDLTVSLLGFPLANRDLTVELRDPTSDAVVRTVKPFLDGTARIPQLEPGAYEMTVKHPNLAVPVLRRPIRILPGGDTKVSVLIDPSKFRNTPIEDIPDANLEPVQTIVKSIAETVLPLGKKQPGEAIRAEDWNAMASGLREVALAVAELTRLVSPTGHNHPEFVTKFDEVTNNFSTLLNTLTAAMTELQRQIQSQRIRTQVEEVLSVAQVPKEDDRSKQLLALVDRLEQNVTATPLVFGKTARNTGVEVEAHLSAILEANQNKPEIVNSVKVATLAKSVEILKTQRTTDYQSEIEHLRTLDRTGAQAGLISIVKAQRSS
jgi:DNA-binding FadR family transcriptional regulator